MVNHTPVEDAAALRELLEESDGAATVEAERGDKTVEVLVQPQKDGEVRLGAYIRDSIAGIGTVTFYDPETGLYGALGHGISDQSTMTLLPLHEGTLVESSVDVYKRQQFQLIQCPLGPVPFAQGGTSQ